MNEPRNANTDSAARFRALLPERMTEIGAAWRAWRAAPTEVDAMRRFQALVHRFAGSASTNREHNIGNPARRVDLILAAWHDEEAALRAPLAELVDAAAPATEELLAVLARAAQAPVAARAESTLTTDGERIGVLMLEDDPEQGTAWSEALFQQGLAVRVVAEEAALEQVLAIERPDVLLIDFWLSGHTAADVGRKLGASREYADIPRVCLTIDAGVQPRQAAMDAGFAAVLRKTIEARDLAGVLRQVVANARRA